MKDVTQIKFVDLLPESIKQDEQVIAAAKALDNELQTIIEATRKLAFLETLDEQPEEIVDELAWQRHVDFYKPDLPLEQKKALVKNSKIMHMRKGTPAAVEDLIAAVFGEGKVVEWFEYGGEPYHFKVVTNDYTLANERSEEFIKALNTVKNARSWLEKIEVTQVEEMNAYFAGILYLGDKLIIEQVV